MKPLITLQFEPSSTSHLETSSSNYINKKYDLTLCRREIREHADISDKAEKITVELYSKSVSESFLIELYHKDGTAVVIYDEETFEKAKKEFRNVDPDCWEMLDWDTERWLITFPLFKNLNKVYAVIYEHI